MSAEASTERSARGLRRQRKFSKDKQLDRKLKVLVLTWNVGNAAPDAAELREWLEEGGGDLDLIVVGTCGRWRRRYWRRGGRCWRRR